MAKRQDAFITVSKPVTRWMFLAFLWLLLAACQTYQSPPVAEMDPPPENLSTPEIPEETASPITPTALSSARSSPTGTPTVNCLQLGGEIRSGKLYSEVLADDFHYQVYLPPCYQSNHDERYPVVYLLHGLSYNEEQWLRLGLAEQLDHLIAEGLLAPFIVVLPREARFSPTQSSGFADALVEELIPWVDQLYRTLPEKSSRAIGGLSRGAAWAVHIGFEHYQLFDRVGAHSLPLFEADAGRLQAWVAQIPDEDLPLFFIDIGRVDRERFTAQDFADQLDQFNIPHTWYLFTGSHTEEYWASHLESYLRWYGADW
jgi:enterochelin esterase-like enzyme